MLTGAFEDYLLCSCTDSLESPQWKSEDLISAELQQSVGTGVSAPDFACNIYLHRQSSCRSSLATFQFKETEVCRRFF